MMHTLVKVNHMIKDHLSLCVKLLNYQSWPIEAREEEKKRDGEQLQELARTGTS